MKTVKKIAFTFIALTLLFGACTPQIYNVGVWTNKEKIKNTYQKVYIISMLNDFLKNSIVERDFSAEAKKRGIAHILNTDLQPATINDRETSKNLTLTLAKEKGCDAIFVIAVKDIKSESRYVPGQVVTTYEPAVSYNYYNRYDSYYSNYYDHVGASGYYNSGYYNGYNTNTVETPGHYEEDLVYFIECNLFDTNTQELLFSIQSKTYNPSDLETISKAYVQATFNTLEKEGIGKSKSAQKK